MNGINATIGILTVIIGWRLAFACRVGVLDAQISHVECMHYATPVTLRWAKCLLGCMESMEVNNSLYLFGWVMVL